MKLDSARLRDRGFLIRVAMAAPFVLAALYWLAVVGLTTPATRLRGELEAEARRALLGRTPVTFVHRPVNQWTRPVRDFYLLLDRDGGLALGYGGRRDRPYRAELEDPVRVGGRFEIRNAGSGVEIELIPAGDSADVASVRALP